MKVFWVWACYQYYPEGALDNVKGCFETLEEAEAFRDSIKEEWDHTGIEDVRRLLEHGVA